VLVIVVIVVAMLVGVRTGCRIHLGIIDLEGGLGRLYGSLGLAVENPELSLEARLSEENILECPDEIKPVIKNVLNELGCSADIRVLSHIPLHKGLGATTQTTLATATAVSKLHNLNLTPDEIADRFNRGKISRIGIEAFNRGGFIINAPVKHHQRSSKTILRVNFPEKWHIILAIPDQKKGYDEKTEERIFQNFPKPPPIYAEKISRILLVSLIPALMDEDLTEFGYAVEEIQRMMGEQFKPVQGDIFTHESSKRIATLLKESGLVGIGQSSWGPTVYGFTDSKKRAELSLKALRENLEKEHVKVILTRGRNEGACIY